MSANKVLLEPRAKPFGLGFNFLHLSDGVMGDVGGLGDFNASVYGANRFWRFLQKRFFFSALLVAARCRLIRLRLRLRRDNPELLERMKRETESPKRSLKSMCGMKGG